MKRTSVLSRNLLVLLPVVLVQLHATDAHAAADRPNIVFIIVDDLNDLPLRPDDKPLAATPNIDRLASQGVSFTNAHSNNPICAPSRASMLFGLYPQTSGLYWFEPWQANGILKTSVSMTRHFRNHGYGVFGTGKVYHGRADDTSFDQQGYPTEIGPWPWDGTTEPQRFLPHPDMQYLLDADPEVPYQWEHHFGPLENIPDWPADAAAGVAGYRGWRLFGKPWRQYADGTRDPLADELSAEWTCEVIGRDHKRPFAVFTGLIRTHTPLYVPKEYFDRYPLDSIEMPEVLEGDAEDCAGPLGDPRLYGFRRHRMLARHTDKPLLKQWVQAYLACVSFVDDQIGTVLDAIDRSPVRDNTIVVLTSDHGYHMGEKDFIYKHSLWDAGTRVPLIVAGVKGMAQGAVCDRPVSLIDVYPTLNDLCNLAAEPNARGNRFPLDGHSLRPLLFDPPSGQWTGPEVAVMAIPGKDHMDLKQFTGTYFPHFSVRSKQWRYSLCANDEEELYNYKTDPKEWKNLAGDPAYAETKAALKAQLIRLRDGSGWVSLDRADRWSHPSGRGTLKAVGDELHFEGRTGFYLATRRLCRDFEFEAEIKSAAACGVRVNYRSRIENDSPVGAAVPIPRTPSDASDAGIEFRPDGWNRYRIRVLGNRCQVWINGRLLSDTRDDVSATPGAISLDYPGAENPSGRLRHVRIRPLWPQSQSQPKNRSARTAS